MDEPASTRNLARLRHLLGRLRASSSVLWVQFLFLLTGILSTILTQDIIYHGGGDSKTMLVPGFTFLGGLLSVFLPSAKNTGSGSVGGGDGEDEREGDHGHGGRSGGWCGLNMTTKQKRDIAIITVIETLAYLCAVRGIYYAGSGLYQVIYASVVIWIALLSYYFMKTRLTSRQWIAICICSFGVACSSLGSTLGSASGSHRGKVVLGIVFTLLCTVLFAMSYVLADKLFKQPSPPPSSTVQFMSTFFSFLFCLLWAIVYVFPNRVELLYKPVAEAKGNSITIIVFYCGISVSAFIHGWAYYKLVKVTGPISTGIIQCLRAVSVFFASSLFYCSHDTSQCLTPSKLTSTLIVVGGVLYYSYLTAQSKSKHDGDNQSRESV